MSSNPIGAISIFDNLGTVDDNDGNNKDVQTIQMSNGNVVHFYVGDVTKGAGLPAGLDIIAVMTDPLGNQITNEFRVNTSISSGDEFDFQAIALETGGFAISYRSDYGVNGQAFMVETYDDNGNFEYSRAIVDTPNGQNPNPGEAYTRMITIADDTGNSGNILVAYDTSIDIPGPFGTILNTSQSVVVGQYTPQTASFIQTDTLGSTNADPNNSADGIRDIALTSLGNNGITVSYVERDPSGNDKTFVHHLNANGTDSGQGATILSEATNQYITKQVQVSDDIVMIGSSNGVGLLSPTLDYVSLPHSLSSVQEGSYAIASDGDGKVAYARYVGAFTNTIMVTHYEVYRDDGIMKYETRGTYTLDGNDGVSVDTLQSLSLEYLQDGRTQVSWTYLDGGTLAVGSVILDPRTDAELDDSPDYSGNLIIGSSENDSLENTNADRIMGLGGNDRVYADQDNVYSTRFEGGAGTDTLLLGGAFQPTVSLDIEQIDQVGFERLDFTDEPAGNYSRSASIAASTLDDFQDIFGQITLTIDLEGKQHVDLSGVEANYSAGTQRFLVNGTDQAETLIMPTVRNNMSATYTGSQIYMADGDDIVTGSDASDRIHGEEGNDTLNGGGASDYLFGGVGDDILNGGLGDDHLFGDLGNDQINGGEGRDNIYFTGSASTMVQNGDLNIVDGGDNIDVVHFASSSFGAFNADIVIQGLEAQDGSIVYRVTSDGTSDSDEGRQHIATLHNVEVIRGSDYDDYLIAANHTGVTFAGSDGNDHLVGSSAGDYLYGDDGDDNINGVGGSYDVLAGGNGNDVLLSGTGHLVMMYGDNVTPGFFQIVGHNGITSYYARLDPNLGDPSAVNQDDLFQISIAENAAVMAFGGEGDDEFTINNSGTGIAYVYGGVGNDTFRLSGTTTGQQEIFGNDGDDTFYGNSENNIFNGGAGADTFHGYLGIDMVSFQDFRNGYDWEQQDTVGVTVNLEEGRGYGGFAEGDQYSGIENIEGSRFADTLIGDDANNVFFGGDGADRLSGGGGDDRLFGNSDLDTAVFSGNSSDYVIAKFNSIDISVLSHGSEGKDTLRGIEFIEFTDTTIDASSVSLFNGLDYIASYADLIGAFGLDPLQGQAHFLDYGFDEGREITFSGSDYIASHNDLIELYGTQWSNGTEHYINYGHAEQRATDLFDARLYIGAHSDVAALYGQNEYGATEHFVLTGYGLGHTQSDFSGLEYIASHTDLMGVYGADSQAGLDHFLNYGFTEGRSTSFDGLQYIATHGDLIGVLGSNADAGADHFIQYGFGEGRAADQFDSRLYIGAHDEVAEQFGTNENAATQFFIETGFGRGHGQNDFSGLEYIASHSDLRGAFGADAAAGQHHFLSYGYQEGRSTSFNGLEYIASYSDLIGAFGSDTNLGASHYIEYGAGEGRESTFDALTYIASHLDLIQAFGANEDAGASHYIAHGHQEGRQSNFDVRRYLDDHSDLMAQFGDDYEAATIHYIEGGYLLPDT